MKILLSFLTALVFLSCSSTKNEMENDQKTKSPLGVAKNSIDRVLEERMVKDGYTLGTVLFLKNFDCEYIIKEENAAAKFDAINFESAQYSDFKQDSLKIYFKYKPLRMMNRCKDALPVKLLSIRKRKE